MYAGDMLAVTWVLRITNLVVASLHQHVLVKITADRTRQSLLEYEESTEIETYSHLVTYPQKYGMNSERTKPTSSIPLNSGRLRRCLGQMPGKKATGSTNALAGSLKEEGRVFRVIIVVTVVLIRILGNRHGLLEELFATVLFVQGNTASGHAFETHDTAVRQDEFGVGTEEAFQQAIFGRSIVIVVLVVIGYIVLHIIQEIVMIE